MFVGHLLNKQNVIIKDKIFTLAARIELLCNFSLTIQRIRGTILLTFLLEWPSPSRFGKVCMLPHYILQSIIAAAFKLVKSLFIISKITPLKWFGGIRSNSWLTPQLTHSSVKIMPHLKMCFNTSISVRFISDSKDSSTWCSFDTLLYFNNMSISFIELLI